MSSGSNPPLSTSNRSSSRVSELRSIHDVISTLRQRFRGADFKEAERELLLREAKLRREKEEMGDKWRAKCANLEAQRSLSVLEAAEFKQELVRREREFELNNEKLSELAMELKAAKEKEERANRRYGDLLRKVEGIDREKEGILEKVKAEQLLCSEKMSALRDEADALRRNLRKKEEEIEALESKNRELSEGREIEAEAMALVDEMKKKLECLEEIKAKCVAEVKELRRIDIEKEKRIQRLVERNSELEVEREKIEELRAKKGEEEDKYDQIEKQVLKLERSVATWMCNATKDPSLEKTQVGKILSAMMKVLDSEVVGNFSELRVKKDGNFGNADVGVVHPGSGAKEVNVIDIDSGSDDDHETLIQYKHKRNLIERDEDQECSSADSLNPKHKVKKLNDITHESVKNDLSDSATSDSRSDHSNGTDRRGSVSALRKCNGRLMGEANDEDDNGEDEDAICSLKVKDLIESCRRSRDKKMS